jgi:hypothetical protein
MIHIEPVAPHLIARSDGSAQRRHTLTRGPCAKLVSLLDYVEQVVRLDDRVAFRLSDFRLAGTRC